MQIMYDIREKINRGGVGGVGGLNPLWEKGGPHWKHMRKKLVGSTFDPLWADDCR